MSNPETIMIDDTKYVRADALPAPLSKDRVIVRGDRSGVFYGTLVERSGSEVMLANCRRIWYWSGAASVSELAIHGTRKPSECKFPEAVSEQMILDAIEIIPCTEAACKSIDSVKPWRG